MPEKFHVVGVGRQPAAGRPAQTAAGLREHLCSNAGTSKAAGRIFTTFAPRQRVSCFLSSLWPRNRRILRQVPRSRTLPSLAHFFPHLNTAAPCRCSFVHANYDSAEDFAALSQHCSAIEEQLCVNRASLPASSFTHHCPQLADSGVRLRMPTGCFTLRCRRPPLLFRQPASTPPRGRATAGRGPSSRSRSAATADRTRSCLLRLLHRSRRTRCTA